MTQFLKTANIPEKSVDLVIVSDYRSEIITELVGNYHIKVISPQPLENINGSERYHADMCVLHMGENRFVVDSGNTDLKNNLKMLGADVALCSNISASMPLLNVCLMNNKMICNEKKTFPEIIRYCLEHDIRIIHTKQGYTKCSIAVLNENALITSDDSVYRLCIKEKIDVLKVVCEGIRLDGYPNGFIGGCCGLLSYDTLAFCGNIKRHTDYNEIRDFALNHRIRIVSLGNGDLYDIGGIIPVAEKEY